MPPKSKIIEGLGSQAVAPVIVVPTSTSEASLNELRAAGYVPIACDSPEAVLVVTPGLQVAGGDLLMSALHGVVRCGCVSAADKFTDELFRRMKAREAHQP